MSRFRTSASSVSGGADFPVAQVSHYRGVAPTVPGAPNAGSTTPSWTSAFVEANVSSAKERNADLAAGYQARAESRARLWRVTAPGEIAMMRLKARLNAATDW